MTNLKKYSVNLTCEDGVNTWKYRRKFYAEPFGEIVEIDKMRQLVNDIDKAANEEQSNDYNNTAVYYIHVHEYYEKYNSDRSISVRVDMDLIRDGRSKVEKIFSDMASLLKS